MKNKVIQLYEFLKEFNNIKNPIIYNFEAYEQRVDLKQIPKSEFIKSYFQENERKIDEILKVRKSKMDDAPQPSDLIINWIKNDYRNIENQTIEVKDSITNTNDFGQTSIEKFEDNPDRTNEYLNWLKMWESWKENNIQAFQAQKLFSLLFSLSTRLEAESETYELVLAEILLKVSTEKNQINHHLITQKVEITYDDDDQAFEIITAEDSTLQLQTAILREIQNFPAGKISELNEYVNEGKIDFENTEEINNLFRKLDNQLQVSLSSFGIPFLIEKYPMIFLRKKQVGYSRFIENVLDDLYDGEGNEISQFIYDLIDPSDFHTQEVEEFSKNSIDGVNEEILLTLPANEEQLRISKVLKKKGAVLVQGPPGTGKTHTIANLIGHLLSEGKSVLVTSQTDKALAVLKDKIVKDNNVDLQSLCISLNKERNQRSEMDIAIDAISTYRARFDEDSRKYSIAQLISKRKLLIEELFNTKTKYIRLKNLEYKDFIYDGKSISPIESSKFVSSGKGKFDYLVGKTKDIFVGLPLSINELNALYRANYHLSKEDLNILSSGIDFESEYWSIETFRRKVNDLSELNKKSTAFKKASFSKDIELIDKRYSKLLEIKDKVLISSDYEEMFNFFLKNKAIYTLLLEELAQAKILVEDFDEYSLKKNRFEIEIKYENLNDDILKDLSDILAKKSSNSFKGIFLLLPNRKKILSNVKTILDLNDPSTLNEIEIILNYEMRKKDSLYKLNKYLSKVNDIYLINEDSFERYIKYNDDKEQALTLYTSTVKPFILDFFKNDIKYIDKIELSNNPFEEVQRLLNEELSKLQEEGTNAKKYLLEKELKDFSIIAEKNKNINEDFANLYDAIENLDIAKYSDIHSKVYASTLKADIFTERKQLLSKLSDRHSSWSQRIEEKVYPHDQMIPPENIEDAWKYNQLSQQLEELTEANKIRIEEDIKNINEKILRNAQELAHEKAWLSSALKQTKAQSQALTEWRQITSKLPKSKKAKKAPRMLNRLRELMPECQLSIPVWIMPLSQVVDNYDPRKNKFDVVIIDEASQADLLALSALYLGKQVIVVGDDKQVSPEIVGVKEDGIIALQNQYLHDVKTKNSFGTTTSIYDLAELAQFEKVVLTEHFRCFPEIISFSNINFYNGKIQPLRDSSRSKLKPHIIDYRVSNGFREDKSKLNRNEADMTVSIILSMLNNEYYHNKTIGVIVMVGSDQAIYIQNELQKYITPDIYKSRKILCGTPYQFQGDERDIIIMNLVDSSDTARLIDGAARGGTYNKSYNVATSRAKDQLIVLHSLNPQVDLKHGDIRLNLLRHISSVSEEKKKALVALTESPFEKEVLEALILRNYKVIPQFKVSGYRIDIVIEGSNGRIALELDGEKYHTEENAEQDFLRQSQLERLGWVFHRIRGSEFYSNKSETINKLITRLSSMGIEPSFNEMSVDKSDTVFSELIRVAENQNLSEFKILTTDRDETSTEANEPLEYSDLNNNPDADLSSQSEKEKFVNDSSSLPESQAKKISLYSLEIPEDYIDDSREYSFLKEGDIIFSKYHGFGKIVRVEKDKIMVKTYNNENPIMLRIDPKYFNIVNKQRLIEEGII